MQGKKLIERIFIMANLNYNKLALDIFGEMAFENAESPIADTQQFITVLENLLNACEPE